MSDRGRICTKPKPVAWRVTSEGQSHVYDTKSEAMFWGDFQAGYSTTPVLVSPLFAGDSKEFAPRGTKRRKPVKLWIRKVMW
jgi:hypothetical protein